MERAVNGRGSNAGKIGMKVRAWFEDKEEEEGGNMIRYDIGGCGLPPWQRLNDAVREEGEHACCTKAWDMVVAWRREFCGFLSVTRGILHC